MSAIWYFTLKANIKKKKRKWEKTILIACEHKVLLPENKLTKFMAQETQESILDGTIRAEKVLEALPSDFDCPWKME